MRCLSRTCVLLLVAFLCSTLVQRACGAEYISDDDTGCTIGDRHRSPYVSAQFLTPVPAHGCISDELTASRQQVHVFNVQQSDGQHRTTRQVHTRHVSLIIKPASDDGVDLSVHAVLVLASRSPVVWKLHSEQIKNLSVDVWVSNYSDVIQDRRIKTNIRKVDLPKSASSLATWTRHKYSAVTSLLTFTSANSVTARIGIGARTTAKCDKFTNLSNAEVYYVRSQSIKGCTLPTTSNVDSAVHVIELVSAGSTPDPNVYVNLYAKSKLATLKRVVLILKAHQTNVVWNLAVHRLRCSLDIISDGLVNSDGIVDVEPFRVVSERIGSHTGKSLIEWTSEKYGQPLSYTLAELANQFDVAVEGDRNHANVKVMSVVTSQRLRRAISTSLSITCTNNSSRIAIPKRAVERYGLSTNDFSLSSILCRATANSTHYLLSSNNSECGTAMHISRDSVIFKNTIMVRYSVDGTMRSESSGPSELHESVGQSLVEADGVSEHRLMINFSCIYPVGLPANPEDPVPYSGGIPVHLRIYRDETLENEIKQYPAAVELNSILYVDASIPNDIGAGVMLRNCSVEANHVWPRHDQQLIAPGCKLSPGVEWLSDDTARQGFKFHVNKSLSVSSSSVSVRCDVIICRLDSANSDLLRANIQQCIPRVVYCLKSPTDNHHTDIVESATNGPLLLVPSSENPSQITGGVTNYMKELTRTCETNVVIDGISSGIVIVIAFAAFAIGVLLMSSLWCIYVRTGQVGKRNKRGVLRSAETSGELTPSSTIGALTARHISPR